MIEAIDLWSTENLIIGSGGEKGKNSEHCVTTMPNSPMHTEPDHAESVAFLRTELRDALLRLHGPLMGGEPLASALGHRSAASLRQARRRGQVATTLFTVMNRRGWFALTLDVADWLVEQRQRAVNPEGTSVPPSLEPKGGSMS